MRIGVSLPMEVNATKLAEFYGVDGRTITNWVNAAPPCPSEKRQRRRIFDTAKVAAWREQRAAERAIAAMQKQRPTDEVEARKRKLIAEAVLAEIAVKEKEEELVSAEVVEATVGELADRLRAACINLPSNYALDLEQAGVEPAVAHAVLERLALDLTIALRAAVEDEPPDLELVP